MLKDYFDLADTKKDNSLSVKELEKFLPTMNISVPKDEFKRLIKVRYFFAMLNYKYLK